MACIVHIRREFVKVKDSTGSPIAIEAIDRIAQLYEVEKRAHHKPPYERVALRQQYAKPIFDDLEAWLMDCLAKMSKKTKLAETIKYALSRPAKAQPYLNNGYLEADNNTAERTTHPVTLGRKKVLSQSLSVFLHCVSVVR